jgi:hypothetical protein
MTNINFSNDDEQGMVLNLDDALYESSDKATPKTKSRVRGLMNSSTYSIKSGTQCNDINYSTIQHNIISISRCQF